MFNNTFQKLLEQIELIRFDSSEAEGSDDFTEKTFIGPIQKQIRVALSYIKAVVIEEKVVKYPDRAEADRFYVDKIKIINYPGPDKYIYRDLIQKQRHQNKTAKSYTLSLLHWSRY
jgi:ATP-dependent DNA helicase RecG